MVRIHVYFSGHVQGVGFRYRAFNLSQSFKALGFVRNLTDGRVELVAEGETGDLEEYVKGLERTFGGHITGVQATFEPATGEWDDFQIAPTS